MARKKKPAKATKFKGTKDAKATRGASPGVALRALDFGALVTAIGQVHERCAIQAGKAVNIAVTVRNWAIGCYIREYQQHASDRAAYGVKLLDSLARRLASARIVGLASRTLRQCRQLYVTYPGMWQALSAKSQGGLPLPGFWQTLSAELPTPTSITTRALAKQRETPTPDSSVNPTRLVAHLSFSHSAELISIDDALKRAGVTKQRHAAVIELKAVPFDPAFIGQFNVYLSAFDDLLHHPNDKSTIGLLLCRSKDRIVVEYALRDLKKPIGVAGWETKIVEKVPENLKGSLPTVEELGAELSPEENER